VEVLFVFAQNLQCEAETGVELEAVRPKRNCRLAADHVRVAAQRPPLLRGRLKNASES